MEERASEDTGKPIDGRPTAVVDMPDGQLVETYDNRFSVGELRYLYDEVFVHDEYGDAIAGLPRDPVVLDVGANLGLFTLRVLRDHPGARVVAVEPIPGTAELLRRNMAAHSGVTVVSAAVGRTSGDVVMTAFRNVLANSTSAPQEKPEAWFARMRNSAPQEADELLATEQVRVPMLPLDAVWPVGAERVHLLKVDVEGAELDVLLGVRDDLWPRVDRVVVEVQSAHTRVTPVLEVLRSNGFHCTAHTPAMMDDDLDCRVVTGSRDPNDQRATTS